MGSVGGAVLIGVLAVVAVVLAKKVMVSNGVGMGGKSSINA